MIFEKLTELVADQFGVSPDDVTMETSFVDDFNADSIDIVELMMAVEQAFGIGEIEENSLEKMKTIGDVVEYIKERV
ncbi:MAG: acyl carrier protein [Clostridium sp. SCN 57-10]|nr:MAG: acyl carrier protein [Clostridium sp. SCN 57-10]